MVWFEWVGVKIGVNRHIGQFYFPRKHHSFSISHLSLTSCVYYVIIAHSAKAIRRKRGNLMRVVEFCCGYGGASAGLVAAGLEYEVGYDNWRIALEAHRRWHPELRVELRDVREVEPRELEGRLVWASLPCQPWSTANRIRRGRDHPHYYPLDHFAHQVQYARAAIIENVPGLLTERDGREELARLERTCARLGLSLSVHLIPALWFGVPQLRRRAILVIGGPLLLFSPPHEPGGAEGWAVTATEGKGGPGRVPTVMASENRGRTGRRMRDSIARTVRATFGSGQDSRRYSQVTDPVVDPYAPRTPAGARILVAPHRGQGGFPLAARPRSGAGHHPGLGGGEIKLKEKLKKLHQIAPGLIFAKSAPFWRGDERVYLLVHEPTGIFLSYGPPGLSTTRFKRSVIDHAAPHLAQLDWTNLNPEDPINYAVYRDEFYRIMRDAFDAVYQEENDGHA